MSRSILPAVQALTRLSRMCSSWGGLSHRHALVTRNVLPGLVGLAYLISPAWPPKTIMVVRREYRPSQSRSFTTVGISPSRTHYHLRTSSSVSVKFNNSTGKSSKAGTTHVLSCLVLLLNASLTEASRLFLYYGLWMCMMPSNSTTNYKGSPMTT